MRMRGPLAVAPFLVAVTALNAAGQRPVSLTDRARGAERIVVAQVTTLTASYEVNEFGDQLIVSHLGLTVEETLKGDGSPKLSLEVEGGTVGDVTLEVSSLPRINRGERAVFFVTRNKDGKFVPHLRGMGILELDSQNRVKGSTLDLNDVRQAAAAAH
jgi:hypothetical protein